MSKRTDDSVEDETGIDPEKNRNDENNDEETAETVGMNDRIRQMMTEMVLTRQARLDDKIRAAMARSNEFDTNFRFKMMRIPDMIPVIGYSDDVAVLAAALGVIAMHIPPEARQLADEKTKEWFGE